MMAPVLGSSCKSRKFESNTLLQGTSELNEDGPGISDKCLRLWNSEWFSFTSLCEAWREDLYWWFIYFYPHPQSLPRRLGGTAIMCWASHFVIEVVDGVPPSYTAWIWLSACPVALGCKAFFSIGYFREKVRSGTLQFFLLSLWWLL